MIPKSHNIGDDWRVDFSSRAAAVTNGMTRVVFYDPADPECYRSAELCLGGYEVEELRWKSLSDWSTQSLAELEQSEQESEGYIRTMLLLHQL